MPISMKKVDGYQVSHGGKVSAKSTSLRKAMAQRRLLEGVKRGWKPTGKSSNLKQVAMARRATKKA